VVIEVLTIRAGLLEAQVAVLVLQEHQGRMSLALAHLVKVSLVELARKV